MYSLGLNDKLFHINEYFRYAVTHGPLQGLTPIKMVQGESINLPNKSPCFNVCFENRYNRAWDYTPGAGLILAGSRKPWSKHVGIRGDT